MELRARTRTLLRRAGLSAALAALLVPAAAAGTAVAKKSKPAPVITSISPRTLAIGETLTIRGRHFRKGRGKNAVAFKRSGAAAIFATADVGTSKLIKVKLPKKLERILLVRSGEHVATKLRLRVLAGRFGRSFSGGARVPLVGPPHPPVLDPPEADPEGDCDGDGQINRVDADDDNDLLLDTLEKSLKTDGCKYDSDGDGVSDGYEHQSSIDLNDDEYRSPAQIILPAPWKKPYPNALFKDADTDYDGDSLTLEEEFELWKNFRDPAKGLNDLVYSDGNQYSAYGRTGSGHRPGGLIGADPVAKYNAFIIWAQGNDYWNVTIPNGPLASAQLNDFDQNGAIAVDGEQTWWDMDAPGSPGFGKLSDDERDEDGDGLSNYDEYHGQAQPGFWTSCYAHEVAYPVKYAGTSPSDADSDGDTVLDGADDQDHDDVPNVMELSRSAASGRAAQSNCKKEGVDPLANILVNEPQGFVNPFNPCLPYTNSRTCSRHPAFTNLPAPFSLKAADMYVIIN
jgi:hypothetical protein